MLNCCRNIYILSRRFCTDKKLDGNLDRHNGVHVDLSKFSIMPLTQFEQSLKASISEWSSKGLTAVWLSVPIENSSFISIAAQFGFTFHHAEGKHSVLNRWLVKDQPNLLPSFASHQVGASGFVWDKENQKVLVVKDKNSPFKFWKLPGGLSNLGEDIETTAEREIFEETGIKTEFKGILAFRQQHNHPGAFGRSDLFFVCRMNPTSYQINHCRREISECQWIDLNNLKEENKTSPITNRIIKLAEHGEKYGYKNTDLVSERFKSVYKGLEYNLYHFCLPGC